MTVLQISSIGLGVASGLALLGLLAANLARPALGIWPARPGWRKTVMLWLFRVYCVAMIAVAGQSLVRDGLGAWPRYAIGLPIMLGAYALSLLAYRALGRRNTYFGSEGLVTGGVYAYSRNPGYVASLAASVGLSVVAGSFIALGFSAGLFAIYFLFALNEERWLARGYGRVFRDYARRTPRFLDQRSLDRALVDLTGRG